MEPNEIVRTLKEFLEKEAKNVFSNQISEMDEKTKENLIRNHQTIGSFYIDYSVNIEERNRLMLEHSNEISNFGNNVYMRNIITNEHFKDAIDTINVSINEYKSSSSVNIFINLCTQYDFIRSFVSCFRSRLKTNYKIKI